MIFPTFEHMVAFRYMRARRQEGFISVIAGFSLLGIGLGVATLIIVMAVMNGFRSELFARILGLNGHANVYAWEGQLTDYGGLAERIAGVPGVVAVTPTVEAQALVTADGAASGTVVRGLTPEAFRTRPILGESIMRGDPEDFGGRGIAIGLRMAQRLGLTVGDELTLVSPRGSPTAFGTAPRLATYPIAVLFDVGMYEYDANFVYMPLETAQTFFRLGEGITALDILVADPQNMDGVLSDLRAVIGHEASLVDWRLLNSSLVNALQVERNVMFLILTLIILVAAFNIISSLIMLVKEKGRDIAILRTMGATRGMILRIFFLSGASVGVVGTIAGSILGIAFALNIEEIRQFLQSLTGTELFSAEIYFLSQLPAEIDWGEVAQVVAMALGLSFAATIFPAWRAARLDPVEALRYE